MLIAFEQAISARDRMVRCWCAKENQGLVKMLPIAEKLVMTKAILVESGIGWIINQTTLWKPLGQQWLERAKKLFRKWQGIAKADKESRGKTYRPFADKAPTEYRDLVMALERWMMETEVRKTFESAAILMAACVCVCVSATAPRTGSV